MQKWGPKISEFSKLDLFNIRFASKVHRNSNTPFDGVPARFLFSKGIRKGTLTFLKIRNKSVLNRIVNRIAMRFYLFKDPFGLEYYMGGIARAKK